MSEVTLSMSLDQAKALRTRLVGSGPNRAVHDLLVQKIDALRPPRLAEQPKGHGAVVRDENGVIWVSLCSNKPDAVDGFRWRALFGTEGKFLTWASDEFWPIALLKEGWIEE